MSIFVTLHGHLYHFTSHSRGSAQFPWKAQSVEDLLLGLGIPSADVFAVVVNGESLPFNASLHAGDHVEVIPAINGG